MRADQGCRVLNVTRLVSRIGRGPLTGVDRVEAAYLQRLRHEPRPLYLLCRTSYGFLLLRGADAEFILAAFSAPETLPAPDWLDRLRGRRDSRVRLEAALRDRAIGRAPHRGVTRLLTHTLPAPIDYIDVGQTSLRPDDLRRLDRVPDLRITVMIHDTIPLDFPAFASDREPQRFHAALQAVAAHADRIIANSQSTAQDLKRHLGLACPPVTTALLGVDTVKFRPEDRPQLDLWPGYFICLGTIEPRKNHHLLLDAWELLLAELPETEVPRLLITGRRGWRNEALFRRLDTAPYMGRVVHELPDLDDAQVAALVAGANGLLMPSFAEGFGLPLLEAAALGTPVLCSPLPVAKELLGAAAIYLNPETPYDWAIKIKDLGRTGPQHHGDNPENFPKIVIPSWTDHFNLVLNKT